MVSGRKKKKGLVNAPKPTRPTPMERIAAQREQRRALQMHTGDPPSATPSSARDPRVNQDDNVRDGYRPESLDQDDDTADNDPMPVVTGPRQQPHRRTILLDADDEEEEREEEEELAHRQPAEEQERALVAEKTSRKVTLTVTQSNAMDRSLLPARQQV